MPAGQPPKYTDPEVVAEIIEEYFNNCTYTHPDTKQEISRPTMGGLAIALDMDRRSLLNYSKKKKFFPTIKKARDRVEEALERNLYSQSVAGTIFNLKNNFGWKDKQETEHTVNGLGELLGQLTETRKPPSERTN